MKVSIGGEAIRIRVEGDPGLARWLRDLYGAAESASSADSDLVVRWRRGGGELRRAGRRLRAGSTRQELRHQAEWAITRETVRRVRARALILHAAWIARGTASVLILGAHGHGKTTLAMAMALRDGWRVLGDDVVIAEADGTLRRLERPVRLKPGALRALPELTKVIDDPGPWRRGWPVLVPLHRLSNGARVPRSAGLIVILGRPSRRALRAEPLAEGMAVAHLARYVWNFRDHPARALKTLAGLARRALTLRIRGGSLDERCAAVREALPC